MKKPLLYRSALLLFGLLAPLIFIPGLRAQTTPTSRPVENRLLLIFDTSASMKKRVPSEVTGIQRLFALQLPGQLHAGDSIGVWTFDREVRTGEMPLRHWQYDATVDVSSNIVRFLEGHHYAHDTSFTELIPRINRLVSDSAQLTVMIFCDGDGQLAGTPVDASVNAIFKQNAAVMKKTRRPFVIVLRSQFGRFIGFTINTPDIINLPSFPPPPPPPQPVVAPAPPPPAPVAVPAPLIIIGNTVKTNPPPEAPAPQPAPSVPAPALTPPPMAPVAPPTAPPNPPPQTISAPSATPAPQPQPAPESIPVPPIVMASTPTNAPIASPPASPPPAAPMIAVATTTEIHLSRAAMLAIGCGGLCLVAILAFIFLRLARPRRSPSLITESLKK